ncbi:hypothetical protein [Sutcliffiella sp. NC1]|uniref:hypothetical protein n=1 Tax=Sutcliffiella sp. NC1 TaxID=3004096 RepID=UPI0022DE7E9D|nr:hypothetical protein [Sutcliffiella sp. NC1]WBL16349.1 hypothetical protein O1A01_06875 [Sutcliffiella sp. NC1]
MSKDNGLIVTMTKKELDDLIYFTAYRASRRASTELFGGMLTYLNQITDQLTEVQEEVEFIKRLLSLKEEKEKNIVTEVAEKPKKNINKLIDEDAEFAEEKTKKKKTPRRKPKEISALELQEAMRNNQLKQG